MILLALALWMKVAATVALVIAGLIITCVLAIFAPGADPETGGTSRDWIPSAVIFALAIIAIWFLAGCTVVSEDRVFPKLAPYWSTEAKRQRADYNQMDRTAHVQTAEDGP
jgi:hypothetical protein